ncbi:hypothetical protein MANES_15G033000v8 [Manihot esculenta]|uniref:Uncharacterized protein n=1 Tax=Manihot esculenta TaxID=3983 RepID=A0ACB7G9K9_MANES|nr:hypothetical protein MANES_15G033000v8 [Manihot esculenta]
MFLPVPLNYLVSSNVVGKRNPLADCSLQVLLILNYYHKCMVGDDPITDTSDDSAASDSLPKANTYFSDLPYSKALENARNIELDCVDIEGKTHNGWLVRLPFASLFDTLGMCLCDETRVLLLHTLMHGNSDCLEYVLVRTDMDILLMPIPETIYSTSKRTLNHIYISLIILIILSQDSSFNASIHKMTSLGSLMVIILIRIMKYNLSKLRDLYLHSTCLATLANVAPHVHCLSAYASQRLSAELHIYIDSLRIVLEILNAILAYALPCNLRQEVFQPFKNHPRFNELTENICMVLDFFNSRIDGHAEDGEWSVEKVLQLMILFGRMLTQLHFSYEEETHPEEFFTPYIWRLALTYCGFSFYPGTINLFPADLSVEQMSKFVQDFWIALIKNGLDVVPNSVDSFFQSFENQL